MLEKWCLAALQSAPCPFHLDSPPSSVKEVTASSPYGSVPKESRGLIQGKSPRRRSSLRSSSSSSAPPSPSPRKRKKSHWSKRSVDSEQLEKLWAAVSHHCSQGTYSGEEPTKRKKSHWSKRSVDSEQLEKLWAAVSHRCSACPPSVPLEQQGAINTDWQQDDMLSIADSKELLPFVKRATKKLQVPWPTDEIRNQSIFEDEPAPSPVSQDYSQRGS
ncbi:UNVERIFIED_CONTAM: hypothetical protein FKN15_023048 [Acipenser sinensis]